MFARPSIFLTHSHEKNSFILSTQTRTRHTHRHTHVHRYKHILKLYKLVRITSVGNNRDTFDISQRELPDISDMTSWKLWKFSKSNRNRVSKREITGNFRHDWSETEELFRSDRRWDERNSFIFVSLKFSAENEDRLNSDHIKNNLKGKCWSCLSVVANPKVKKKRHKKTKNKKHRTHSSLSRYGLFGKNILMKESAFLKRKNIDLLNCDSRCDRMVKHSGIYHTVNQRMVSPAKHVRSVSDCTFSLLRFPEYTSR